MENKINLEKRIKRHVKAKSHDFFAIVTPNFENTLLKELNNLGITNIKKITKGGIEFEANLNDCYRVNLFSKTLTRLTMRLFSFKTTNFNTLFKKVYNFSWELYLSKNVKIDFKIESIKSRLYHSEGIKEEIKRAIYKRLNEYDINLDEDEALPVQYIFVRLQNDRCQISLDTSGELLYKRGVKKFVCKAPLRENIAASILLEANLFEMDIIFDPMAGSGTFSIEALNILNFENPNLTRDFIFKKWPCFSEKTFNHIIKKYREEKKEHKIISIITGDIDLQNIEIIKKNISSLKNSNVIKIEHLDFFSDIKKIPDDKKSLILLNPPYGKRINLNNTTDFYKKILDTLNKYYKNSSYAIIVPSSIKNKVNIPYDKIIKFKNGGIPVEVRIKFK